MKECSRCKTEKPLTEYGKNKSRKDGLQSNCNECRVEVNRLYYLATPHRNDQRRSTTMRMREAAREYVLNYLRSHPCVDCGEKDIVVLDFDHVKGTKVLDVSRMVNRGCSIATIQKEIEKCEVRCANDHRRVTFARAGWIRI